MNDVLREPVYADPLKRNLLISAGLHAALVVAFAVKAAWIPSDELLIRNAIRVDVVGMPDKVKTPVAAPAKAAPKPVPPKAEAKPQPKAETKPPAVPAVKKDTTDPKKIESKQKEALKRLKAQQAIENMRREVAEKEAQARAAQAQTFKGNQVTQGDGLTGLEKIEFDRYFGSIETQIRSNWNLPGWLAQAELKAQALVLIDAAGQVIKRQVIKSSGNEVFDAQVLDAIDKSSPFPQPPDRLKNVLALKGIIFNFPD